MMDNYFSCLMRFVVSFGEQQGWSPMHINKAYILLMEDLLRVVISYDVGKYPIISGTHDIIHDDYRKGLIKTDPKLIFTRINRPKDISEYDKIEQKIDTICEAMDHIRPEMERKDIYIPSYIINSTQIKNKLRMIGEPRGNYQHKVNELARQADQKILKRIEASNLEYIHPNILCDLEDVQNVNNFKQLLEMLRRSKGGKS